MAKNTRYDPPTIEQEVPVLQPQPTFSFMNLVKKTGSLPKSGRSKLTDPLTLAKEKIIKALQTQKEYALLVADGKPIPKTGEREKTTWFSKQSDGWWANIRYGQKTIKIDGNPDLFIGTLEDVATFFDSVAEAITKGEMDTQILAIQSERSASKVNH